MQDQEGFEVCVMFKGGCREEEEERPNERRTTDLRASLNKQINQRCAPFLIFINSQRTCGSSLLASLLSRPPLEITAFLVLSIRVFEETFSWLSFIVHLYTLHFEYCFVGIWL